MSKIFLATFSILFALLGWACPNPTELQNIFIKNDWTDAIPITYILEKHTMEYLYVIGRENRQQTKIFFLTHIEGQEMEDLLQKIPHYMNALTLRTPRPIPFKIMPNASFDVCSYEVTSHPEIKGSFFIVNTMEQKSKLLKSMFPR